MFHKHNYSSQRKPCINVKLKQMLISIMVTLNLVFLVFLCPLVILLVNSRCSSLMLNHQLIDHVNIQSIINLGSRNVLTHSV